MNIPECDLAAIGELGFIREEAVFLYIVATHSGYFQLRQFALSNDMPSNQHAQRFAERLERRGLVTWREYQDVGGVYHLCSKTLYRQMDNADLRNSRRHSTEYIRTRLLLLDFILDHPEHDYFETEADKLEYFCRQRGLPKESMPSNRYGDARRGAPSLRYFVDRFPMFLDRSRHPESSVLTLSYVQSGLASLAAFRHHLEKYAPLFSQIGSFSFLYLARSPAQFVKVEKCFASIVAKRLGEQQIDEIQTYFGRRQAWELKRYGSLSSADVESLHLAKQRFASRDLEELYSLWSSGALDERGLRAALARRFSTFQVEFRCCLYQVGRPNVNDARNGRRKAS